MKIALYYTRPFETGGVEKTMYARGKYLASKGYDITFIFASEDSPIDILLKWAEVGKVKHIEVVDEVFDYCIYDAVYNLKRVKARKYIQVINGNLMQSKEFYDEIIPFNEYVAVSEESADQFKQLKGKNCKIIPNMIDEKEVIKLSKEPADIPKAKYVFLTVSRIDRQKGFERIEKILQQLEANNVDYHWLFIGSNYLYPAYEQQIRRRFSKYKCTFLGKQDNPYKYMSKVDRLIQLSDYESQCMVMYESLICGTPCLCTSFKTAKDTLTGDLGVVVDNSLNNFKLTDILVKKPKIEYHYPNYGKEWEKLLQPIEKKDYKYSIIIPNYNNEAYLEKCINSILNQTYKNYEIIFIDDVSTDNSVKIAKKLLKGHKVIELNRKRYNGGTRNVGILEATGDYIICIDSDDWLKNNKVIETINDNLYGEDVMFLGFELYKNGKEGVSPFIPEHKDLYDAFIDDVCAIWTKVIKRELLQDTLFPESTLAEDKVHNYRICDKAKSFTCLPVITHVWNRCNNSSVTTKRNILWEASIYKHVGEMYLFMNTTKNDKYKDYVKKKIRLQLAEISKGRYNQI